MVRSLALSSLVLILLGGSACAARIGLQPGGEDPGAGDENPSDDDDWEGDDDDWEGDDDDWEGDDDDSAGWGEGDDDDWGDDDDSAGGFDVPEECIDEMEAADACFDELFGDGDQEPSEAALQACIELDDAFIACVEQYGDGIPGIDLGDLDDEEEEEE